MQHRFSLSIILVVFLSAAFYFLPGAIGLTEQDAENPLEENAERVALETKMLADPLTGEIPAGIAYQNIEFLHALQASFPTKKGRGAIWNNRGPWNVGGRTRAIAIDVNDEKHILAGGVSGGIWQSTDGGVSWKRVSDVNGHPGVVSITQDPRPGKTNLWYALSGEIYGTSASGGGSFYLGDGAFKSLDNGSTWTPITSTASGTPSAFITSFQGGWRIAASPVDSIAACLYMATYGTIYRSKDTGKTWKAVVGSGNDSYFTDVRVSSKGLVYASLSTDGTNTRGFFRSADGLKFTDITPSFLKSADRTVIEINPSNENEVYFLSELPTDSSGGVVTANYEGSKEYVSLYKYTYISGDGTGAGGQWTNLSPNLPVNSTNPFDRFNCQGGYDLFVKMQPGTSTLIIGGTNVYRSTDAFTTPDHIKQIGGYGIGTTIPFFTVYLNHHPDQHDLIFLKSDPKKAYSVSDGGVKFTDNINAPTVEWQDRSMGYVTSQLYSIAIDENSAYDQWMVGGFQDNGNYVSNTSDSKHSWVMPVNGDGAYNYIAPNKEYFVMSIQQGRMVKVELDKHGHLLARRRIDPFGFEKADYAFINPFIVDPNNNNFLYMPIGKRIARLNNLNSLAVNNDYSQLKTGWTILSDTITTPNFGTANTTVAEITSLAVSSNEPNILYFGTSNKEMYRIDQANTGDPKYIKLDTITKRLLGGGFVSSIAVDPDSAKNVLICFSNYKINSLFFSNDYGMNWYFVGGNLESSTANPTGADPSIRCVKILVGANGKRTYFAGTSIGLFSTDTLILAASASSAINKTVWKQESADKIGAAIVTDIKVRPSDGYVAVATHGSGTFESYYTGKIPPVAANTSSELTAYPNPASDKIYFSFDATNTNLYNTEVYDISGRRITALSNGINYNNVFTQVLDVSRYPNGHYFISYYTSDNRKQVKHFIVRH